ncbi:MAG: ATP/GTP-binding protein [Candidatus Thorarchaeota archaeon]
MLFAFIVGTAGSGKSTLTQSLQKWLVDAGLNIATVNLDPGIERAPYLIDVDVRSYVSYPRVMEQFGLGPNGALVACLDMTVNHIRELRDEILDTDADYVLVDCPGQMELFAYRNSGPMVVDGLRGKEQAMSLYLLDSNMARTPEGYLSSMLLGMSVWIRFGLPQLNVLSKCDLLDPEEVDRLLNWSAEPFAIEDDLEKSSGGMIKEFTYALLRMLDDLGGLGATIPTSSRNMTGLDELYGEMQRVFMGGEDTLR